LRVKGVQKLMDELDILYEKIPKELKKTVGRIVEIENDLEREHVIENYEPEPPTWKI